MSTSRSRISRPHNMPRCRCPGITECLLSEAPFDQFESDTLAVIRQCCAAMSPECPPGQGDVFGTAARVFPRDKQMFLATALVGFVQTMALGRSDKFTYSNPACPGCAVVLTETERHLLSVLHHVRRGEMGRAVTYAAMLCDQSPAEPLIAAAVDVARLAPPARG